MQKELLDLYQKCRQAKPFMLAGEDAACSLRVAKTILAFRELESRGLVRLRAEPEQENYFDVFGDPEAYTNAQGHEVSAEKAKEELIATLERDGLWWSCSEWYDGRRWQQADSCGMHAGYKNPLDPFENCYIVDHMRSAVEAWEAHLEEMAAAI